MSPKKLRIIEDLLGKFRDKGVYYLPAGFGEILGLQGPEQLPNREVSLRRLRDSMKGASGGRIKKLTAALINEFEKRWPNG